MRRVIATIALSVFVLSCGRVRQPAPSGEPIELANAWEGVCSNTWGPDRWVEGSLRAGHDLSREDRPMTAWMYLDLRPGTKWPASIPSDDGMIDLDGGVAVFWSRDFSGRRLATDDVAVVDPSGNLVAVTGSNYKLKVQLPFTVAAGYPDTARIEGFQACAGPDTVIPD